MSDDRQDLGSLHLRYAPTQNENGPKYQGQLLFNNGKWLRVALWPAKAKADGRAPSPNVLLQGHASTMEGEKVVYINCLKPKDGAKYCMTAMMSMTVDGAEHNFISFIYKQSNDGFYFGSILLQEERKPKQDEATSFSFTATQAAKKATSKQFDLPI